ncbi:hypothetical protein KO361_00885 [Candidatus Woesearchaeota archaeon]|nr:hypothetical protein [Candidatus Woesearchaeota archaeon]
MNKVMPEAYLCKDLKNRVENLKSLVKSTMEQVHSKYSFKDEDISDNKFQDEVIRHIKKSLKSSDFYQLDAIVKVWTDARGSTIKKYFDSRMEVDEGVNPRRFLKVATKGNSQGSLTQVLEEDLEPWVDCVSNVLKKAHNRNFLSGTSTKKQVLSRLKTMIDYPVSIKETPVNSHVSEEGIETLILNEPDKYLPSSAVKILSENPGLDWKDIAIVTANVLEYDVVSKKTSKKARLEGRIKSSEAMKLAKYVSGIRKEPMYDGIGVMELCESIDDINKHVSQALLLKSNRNHNLSHRYPLSLDDKSISKTLRESFDASEEAVVELLRTSYLIGNNELSEHRVNKCKSALVYGTWLDMNLKSNKSPIEVQFKDNLGYFLYVFNSPFGHNSKAYNSMRTNELFKKVKIKNKEYNVNKIAEYVANEIFLPAFLSSRNYS